MAVVQIISTKERAGKTAVAVGLAQGFAASTPVRLVRLTGAGGVADATTYAGYTFASTPGAAVSGDNLPQFSPNETVIVEAESDAAPLSNVPAILVVRGAVSDEDREMSSSLGDRLIGTIATDVPHAQVEAVARELTNASLRPLAILPEDRALAAPSVGEIRDILNAQVLYEGENELEVVEDVLLSPVYADPARPHFRRFSSKAILAPFNKTDFHLAAIETQAACLVITGGHDPSPYVVDRAQGEATTVLLAPHETPETLSELSDVWLTSRFRGARKAEAIHELLESRIDFAGLLRRLS